MPIVRRSSNRVGQRLPAPGAEDLQELKKMVRESAYKTHSGAPIIFLVLRHRAASGMSRIIAPIVFTKNQPLFIGYRVAQLLKMSYDRDKEGIRIGGAGMDMGFHLIDTLSHKLGIPLKHEWL